MRYSRRTLDASVWISEGEAYLGDRGLQVVRVAVP
jgi:hypothetical protein